MALYAIADTHLSFGTDKPMDSFPGWSDYTARLAANWRHLVEPQDTVVIAGDSLWFQPGILRCFQRSSFQRGRLQ